MPKFSFPSCGKLLKNGRLWGSVATKTKGYFSLRRGGFVLEMDAFLPQVPSRCLDEKIKGFLPTGEDLFFKVKVPLDGAFSFVPGSPRHWKDVCSKLRLGILYPCPGAPRASADPGSLSRGSSRAGDGSFSGGLGVSTFVSPATGHTLPLVPGVAVFSGSLRSQRKRSPPRRPFQGKLDASSPVTL